MGDGNKYLVSWNSSFDENISSILQKFDDSYFIYDQLQNTILIFTYIPLFLIALTSNILVILVVGRFRCLRSVTNYFLVNLSVADLLVTLICMPMAVGKAVHSLWLYGEVMCKLTHYLTGVAVGSSVFTITAMSIDRYMAIRHPMSRKIINRRTTRKVILILWVVALLIFSPILFIRKSNGFEITGHREYIYCIEDWPDDNLTRRTFGIFCFIIVYAIPGCIVVIAYSLMGLRLCSRQLLPEYQLTHRQQSPGSNSRNELGHCDSGNSAWQVSSAGGRLIRERRRVAKILLILALVFAFCWLPYSVLSLILDFKTKYRNPSDENSSEKVEYSSSPSLEDTLLPFAILLGHANSAVNPLLYCLLSKNFRRSVAELLRHPTRVVRGRQQCKIRMTFRKDPPPSDAASSKEQVSNQNRPRNHHTPEPTKPALPLNNLEVGELCIVEIGHSGGNGALQPAYSPSSSGYSSLRQSTEALQGHKDYSHVYAHSSQYPFFTSSTCSGNCRAMGDYSTGSQAVLAILAKRCQCVGEVRKFNVPSTIREESESVQSAKSRSSVGIRIP